ncbi:arylsulfatase B-like [Photinus pyralis]|uniref:arylsulfatase B-like n=1 Tax=Photinus pyralis TaxID=7054 RepID=UPI0012674713|nr:arylsulfatase B-like [Photinus pyralis]XP_031340549.1 arylsulfatase B-like [Photinus pyralis]
METICAINGSVSKLWSIVLLIQYANAAGPHIVFILADDLGWNDVSFHGSSQILTPNIDALAYSGLILNNYYVMPLCTPSRSALMTGKHPIHTGMQHGVIYGAEPRGLPLSETLLPQYLKELGYATHIVGKWHLGSYKKEYTPTFRGFDSHLGFWTGRHDYNDHTATENRMWGLDMRRNMDVAWDLHGNYSTDIFSSESERIIANHNRSNPLFLYIAHAAVHSGNVYNPLPVPDRIVAKLESIPDYKRRRFAGMLTKLDESVGRVVRALQAKNMLKDSIIVFSTDNGGPASGFNLNAASNWPLRGIKNTLWEGGVRGAALLWSPLIKAKQRVAFQKMHVTDWLPTLYSAAGGDLNRIEGIDGYDLWDALSTNGESPRNEILHNIDEDFGVSALTVGKWKILHGSTYNGTWDNWYGPSGRNGFYNATKVLTSPAGKAISKIKVSTNSAVIAHLRKVADVDCGAQKNSFPCKPLEAPCLFDLETDPCERTNLATDHPDTLRKLAARLQEWKETAIPPNNLPLDQKANPKNWGHTWTNFGDYLDYYVAS